MTRQIEAQCPQRRGRGRRQRRARPSAHRGRPQHDPALDRPGLRRRERPRPVLRPDARDRRPALRFPPGRRPANSPRDRGVSGAGKAEIEERAAWA